MTHFQGFLYEFEGVEGMEDDEAGQQPAIDGEIENPPSSDQFLTTFGELDGVQIVAILHDQSAFHSITKSDIFNEPITAPENSATLENSVFSLDSRYAANAFQGIMPDTGAAGVSTAGEPQVQALQRLDNSITIDRSTAGQHMIRIGKGKVVSLGTIGVQTPLGHIVMNGQLMPYSCHVMHQSSLMHGTSCTSEE